MEKNWKPLLNNYEISDHGDILSKKYNKLLKPWLSGKGYHRIDLGRGTRKSVHRLVAEMFIPNPENKPTVNHKNHDKTDNRASNLEWMTYKEQTAHDIKCGRKKMIKGTNGKFEKQSH